MAAVSVRKMFTSRGGTDDFSKHRTYTRVYEVWTDDEADDEQIVGVADVDGVAIPELGAEFEPDPDAVVVSLVAEQSDETPLLWYVTVEYDTDPPSVNADKPEQNVGFDGAGAGEVIDKTDRPENPLAEPATWTLTFEDDEEPAIEGLRVSPTGAILFDVPGNWAANQQYTPGVYVRNGANVYLNANVTASVSASGGAGPAGAGTGIADSPDAWQASNDYNAAGEYAINNGNVYRVATVGRSAAAGGPTGTEGAIADGTVVWNYAGAAAVWDFYATFADTQNDPNKATNRVAITDSARMPFDPPVMIPVSRIVLTVTKNMPIATVEYLLLLKNAVNATPWKGAPARCARIKDVTHDGGKQTNGIKFVTTKWEIAIDADTFDLRVLDAGFYERVTYTDEDTQEQVTEIVRIKDANDDGATVPFLLDGNGRKLAHGAPPVFLRFVPAQQRIIDFNALLPF
jgi:hypothetical protein